MLTEKTVRARLKELKKARARVCEYFGDVSHDFPERARVKLDAMMYVLEYVLKENSVLPIRELSSVISYHADCVLGIGDRRRDTRE